MSHPSDKEQPSSHFPFWQEGLQQQHISKQLVGIALFEKTFDFYTWYLSYDLNPSKHHSIFESLSLLMQIAKLSFEGGGILSLKEEQWILKDLHDLSEGLSNGKLKNQDLCYALEYLLKKLSNTNAKARLITVLVRLEYKICGHHEASYKEISHTTFKQLIQSSFQKISQSLPDLITSTLARELEKLLDKPLDADTFLKEFHNSLALLNHTY